MSIDFFQGWSAAADRFELVTLSPAQRAEILALRRGVSVPAIATLLTRLYREDVDKRAGDMLPVYNRDDEIAFGMAYLDMHDIPKHRNVLKVKAGELDAPYVAIQQQLRENPQAQWFWYQTLNRVAAASSGFDEGETVDMGAEFLQHFAGVDIRAHQQYPRPDVILPESVEESGDA